MIRLSDEQEAGINSLMRARQGQVILWLGRAGSGKSYTVKELQRRLPNTLVGAYSGITARALDGITIDKLCNYPVEANRRYGFVFNPKWKYNDYVYQLRLLDEKHNTRYAAIHSANKPKRNWKDPKVPELKPYAEEARLASCIIIEEVGAITCDKLDHLDMLLRYVMKEPHLVFGGKKVLLLGDFAQFKPIIQDNRRKAYEKAGYAEPFDITTCEFLKQCDLVTHNFTKVYRQSNQIDVNRLNRLANGTCIDQDLLAFSHNVRKSAPEGAVVLCERKEPAKHHNQDAIANMPGELITLEEVRSGTMKRSGDKGLYADTLYLKPGCRIIIKVNGTCKVCECETPGCRKKSHERYEHEYVNGDACRFRYIDKTGRLVVTREADGQTLFIKRDRYNDYKATFAEEIRENEQGEQEVVTVAKRKPCGYIEQYPITLGYAQTGHSSQGMTLDKIHVVLGPKRPFCINWLYVVLSRCTSIENISLNRPLTHEDIWSSIKGQVQPQQQYQINL